MVDLKVDWKARLRVGCSVVVKAVDLESSWVELMGSWWADSMVVPTDASMAGCSDACWAGWKAAW